jgi:hexosaminidase
VKNIKCNFLSHNQNWIFLPKKVTVQVSEDGITYRNIGENNFSSEKEVKGPTIQPVTYTAKSKIRFIKFQAQNQGFCPAWHQGAGNKCWLFVDEIVVE